MNKPSVASQDKGISLLEVLKTNPNAGQRDMAEAIGMSLGMTNHLLKELSAKGWMLMRKLNSRKIQYVLTPEGMLELSRRSFRYLKKTIRHVADCRAQLLNLVLEVKRSSAQGLLLSGSSEIGFVLEHLCHQHGVAYLSSHEVLLQDWFIVFSEETPSKRPNLLDYLEVVL